MAENLDWHAGSNPVMLLDLQNLIRLREGRSPFQRSACLTRHLTTTGEIQ